ncbi:3-oxoadipate enol-lactonase [Chimaeribacter coloradensis]|uniref:3-oxoadipate enol-lactonase n=1 Tax=Chimaeribacter coloradensis TaxID=2060068 RepID=A0A2N5E822_9GAMM|nr:3-oxoadipate enol-lactonase [Chimaeribacter coloradensis]PLR37630.1 3-oxoadipate enol-lactonase [Chimaeribacter coloradensis]
MEIDYRLDGPEQAPLLVLSNSLGTTYSLWQPQMAALTAHFRVLRYNQRGHGATPLPAEPLTLAQLGDDVIALLNHVGVERAYFCGISMGGLTGMWLNRYAPSRFHAFAVANTAARIGSREGWQARAETVRTQGLKPVAEASPARWFSAAFIQRHPDQVNALASALAAADAEGYAACCGALAAADLRSALPAMVRPMLVLAGQDDPVTTVQDATEIVRHAPDAELHILPASHLSNIAVPEAFTARLLHFLQRQGAADEYSNRTY